MPAAPQNKTKNSSRKTAARLQAARQVLQDVFAFDDFRTGQLEAVEAAMAGNDAAVLLPTGAGKSLCYQVPAIALARLGEGPTLVVSPLIALMHDQVRALTGRGVRAAALNSHLSDSESLAVINAYRDGDIELLYVSPERAAAPSFRRLLAQRPPALFAIDEAHCVSQWGHDFRPEYMQLNELREHAHVPMMAVTATATPKVLKEVSKRLALEHPVVVRGDFRRPNLTFSVEHIPGHARRLDRLAGLLEAEGLREGKAESGKAIVYCSTRKHTETVAADLASRGFAARHYHAGRTKRDRERAQHAFGVGRLRVLVATNAFGMGIDFPDVRMVVHYQTPASVEAYYQEAGRAGRDKEPARCVMFFSTADIVTQRRIVSGAGVGDALRAMEEYAGDCVCREQAICLHFGLEAEEVCGRCDLCTGEQMHAPDVLPPPEAITAAQRAVIVEAVGQLTKPAGKTNLARALRGSKAKALNKCGLRKMGNHGALRGVEERAIVAAIEDCLNTGELVRKGNKYPTVWLPGKPVRAAKAEPQLAFPKPSPRAKRTRSHYSLLQGALERFRTRKARELKWKPYMVFQKRTIAALDDQRPATLRELEAVPGLGKAKIERFGEELLRIVAENP